MISGGVNRNDIYNLKVLFCRMLYPKRLQEDHLIDARVHGIFF